MRILIILTCINVSSFSPCLSQSNTEDRSGILYVIGRVTGATKTSCVVDLGAAHTVASQDQLVVFRPTYGHFRPVGRITVVEADSTKSRCRNQSRSQRGDIVMTVREMNQLHPGARHRDHIVRRQVVRSYRQTSFSTVNNVELASVLSDYELQYPKWERSRGAVAGTLLTASLQKFAEEPLQRLMSQVNMMRRLYQQDAQTVMAAGATWSGIMPLLAGRTAKSAHAMRLKDLNDGDLSEDSIQVAAAELRNRVFDRIFQLRREQQNVIALIVASLISGSSRDPSIRLRTSISQTQFPGLNDDPQLLEDVGELVLSIRDGI